MGTLREIIERKPLRDNRGFTLIEIVVVIAIVALMFMIAAPRITRVFSSQRENFAIFTGMIVKTFEDSFLNNRTNFLVVHLQSPDPDETPGEDDFGHRQNGISVRIYSEGKFVDSKLKSLKFKEFPDSFLIEEVILPNGEKMTTGNAMITFYPQGYSDNNIIHILVNGDRQWSIKIDKHIKEPKVIEGWIGHETE
jgi:prepilin-type N-terminal cleavage/methylation domain-containing protein